MEEKDNQSVAPTEAPLGSSVPSTSANSASSNTAEHMRALGWVNKTEGAESDALKAIEQKDFRLLVTSGRGSSAPGIPFDLMTAMMERCGTKFIEGSTDMLRGEEHKDMMLKALEYAKIYNKTIVKHCP
jgi:hypothetical protein